MTLRYAQLARPMLSRSRGRTAAALLVLLGGWVVCLAVTVMLFSVTGAVDLVLDSTDPTSFTPAVLLVSLLVVPLSWLPPALAACQVLGMAPSSLCSVTGRFRWGWYGRCVGVTAVLATLCATLPLLWTDPPTLAPAADWAVLVVVVLCVVPLQSFTEEFFCRGVLTHILGARWANPLWAVVVSAVLSSLVFSAVHLAAGLALFASRVIGGLAYSVLCDRTGGLEAASAAHNAWNTTALLSVIAFPTAAAGMGAASLVAVLVSEAVVVVVVTVLARRHGVRTTTLGPGARLEVPA